MGQQIFTKIWPQIYLIMLNTFTQCQNLAKPNGFGDIYKKSAVWSLCSIFSNGSHVFKLIKNPNSPFVQDTLRNNHYKFHANLFSSFIGEDVWRNCYRQQMQSDGNSSQGLWPGELKIISQHLINNITELIVVATYSIK